MEEEERRRVKQIMINIANTMLKKKLKKKKKKNVMQVIFKFSVLSAGILLMPFVFKFLTSLVTYPF